MTTTEAFDAPMPEPAEYACIGGVSQNVYTADQMREAIRKDAERLDWIIRQADEFSCTVIVDAPGDGEYMVHGMDGWGQGKTAREAIDNAMQFNGAAAIRASGGKGAA